MSTANWITLLATGLALAVTWGEVRARLKAVERLASKLSADVEKSRGTQGARIGGVEDRIAHLEGALRLKRRRATRPTGIPLAEAEAHGDESGGTE